MSDPLNEEVLSCTTNDDNGSTPDPVVETVNKISEGVECEPIDNQEISSTSTSQSLSSEYTPPHETLPNLFGISGSVVDDTDDLSSSLSSSPSHLISGNVAVQKTSAESVTSGSESEEIFSDETSSNLSSSESFAGADRCPFEDDDIVENNEDCARFSSDGFETEDSDEKSSATAVQTFKRFVTQGNHIRRSKRAKSGFAQAQGSRSNPRQGFAGTSREIVNPDPSPLRNRNQDIILLRRLDNFLHRMSVRAARYHKELCIVFLVFASGIASLRSASPKIRATSVPSPFYEEKDAGRFLQDNYMGEYVDLASKQIPFHPSFLFYYAPWDSESVASRSVFLDVAKHFFFAYHGQVKFYAINCWWPVGQCRKNYKNLSHYPIFVAHIGKAAGIIYNGPIRLEPMIKFLNSLLKPLTRIDSEEELWRFRAQHDVIMLGYFNFTSSEANEAYETYLQMALRTFEADPFNQVGFGLFLRSDLADKFFLTSSNAISLVLFNEIHTAKWHGGYHTQGLKGPVNQVAEWIIERTKSVPITWVYALRNGFANRPVALGPHDFAQQLTKGPIFLLVTRRYFPSGHSPFYMQTKEIALDYFNCNKSGNVTKLRRTAHKVNAEWASLWSSVIEICQRKGSMQCQRLLPNIIHWQKKRSLFKREPLQRYENMSTSLNFTGLSCLSERQFKFLAIDPVDVPYFIRLGLSGLESTDGDLRDYYIDPMAFIIDSQNDIILPLQSLNISEIAAAIHNYTQITEKGNVEKIPTRLFLNDNKNLGGFKQETQVKPKSSKNNFETWGSADLIRYINNETQHNDSVLLLYTASFCGYCAVAVTHLVSLSRFIAENFSQQSLKVSLAKIDMFKNSLPPELSPEKLPTVVFLPSWNRSDIRLYPQTQDITSLGLLRFILSELDPITRVEVSLKSPLCGHNSGSCRLKGADCQPRSYSMWTQSNLTNAEDERRTCIKSSRSSVSNQIEVLLQRLRNGEEALFDDKQGPINPMITQTWNGQLLERLRTLAMNLDVS